MHMRLMHPDETGEIARLLCKWAYNGTKSSKVKKFLRQHVGGSETKLFHRTYLLIGDDGETLAIVTYGDWDAYEEKESKPIVDLWFVAQNPDFEENICGFAREAAVRFKADCHPHAHVIIVQAQAHIDEFEEIAFYQITFKGDDYNEGTIGDITSIVARIA